MGKARVAAVEDELDQREVRGQEQDETAAPTAKKRKATERSPSDQEWLLTGRVIRLLEQAPSKQSARNVLAYLTNRYAKVEVEPTA